MRGCRMRKQTEAARDDNISAFRETLNTRVGEDCEESNSFLNQTAKRATEEFPEAISPASLELDPPVKLFFTSVTCSLKNGSDESVAYKIGTTACQSYHARPCKGLLEPQQAVDIMISIKDGEEAEVMTAKSDQELKTSDDWDQIPTTSNRAVVLASKAHQCVLSVLSCAARFPSAVGKRLSKSLSKGEPESMPTSNETEAVPTAATNLERLNPQKLKQCVRPAMVLAFVVLILYKFQEYSVCTLTSRALEQQALTQKRVDDLVSVKEHAVLAKSFSLVRVEAEKLLLPPGLSTAVSRKDSKAKELADNIEETWRNLLGAANLCTDKGRCLIEAWDKFELWKERQHEKLKADSRKQLEELQVPGKELDQSIEAQRLQQEHWLNLVDKLASIDDRRTRAQRIRDGASQLGFGIDRFFCLAFSLTASMTASLLGGGWARSSLQHARQNARWIDVGVWLLGPLFRFLTGAVCNNVISVFLGPVGEMLGVIVFVIAVLLPRILVSFLNFCSPAVFLGFQPSMLPGEYVEFAAVCISWALGNFLQYVIHHLDRSSTVGGPLAAILSGKWPLLASVILIGIGLSRGAFFLFSIVI